MNCARCGKELRPEAKICSGCGTVTMLGLSSSPSNPSNTSYGQFPNEWETETQLSPKYETGNENVDDGEYETFISGSGSNYEAGYAPQRNKRPPLPPMPPLPMQPPPPRPQTPLFAYGPTPIYQTPPLFVTAMQPNVYPPYAPIPATKNVGALIAEIFLSLIGIFGVGWLIAGETTVGVVLLICSFLVIAPIALFIAFITFGIGIFVCDLPLAVAGIIINAILLNNRLNRKAQQQYFYAQPAQQTPPPMQQMRMPPQ